MLILSNVVPVAKRSHLEIFTFNITNQNMEIFHRNITIEKNSFVISARKSFWKNIGELILGVESHLVHGFFRCKNTPILYHLGINKNLFKVGISALKFIEFIETKVNRFGKVLIKSTLIFNKKKQILRHF